MKTVNLNEFVEKGYLHELNRRFLHPLGMALVFATDDDGTTSIVGIQDEREDPEGIYFAELDEAKIANVSAEEDARLEPRVKALGYFIQQPDADALMASLEKQS